MSRSLNRRSFLMTSAAAGYFVGTSSAAESNAPGERLNLGFVGTANKAWDNIRQLSQHNIAALCDVDANYLARAAKEFPAARQYRDYREMLESEHAQLDGVVVSTPDHSHAPATSIALDLGKAVYCEKPLTHSVQEARVIAELASRRGVATQMGTQIHASDNYRRVVEQIQAGVIGEVTSVHCWCNKGWSNGRFAAAGETAPKHLDWDLWLGPAKARAYSAKIHPADWRRFWEYGSGTFGDMACHIMDLPFWALNLRHPTSVQCAGPPLHPDGVPAWTEASYEFAARDGQPAVTLTWTDGGKHVDLVRTTTDHDGKPLSSWGLGILFVGDQGMLAADYGRRQLLPTEKFADVTPLEPTLAKSVGHWKEWADAIKTGSPTTCNFDYSGALTEAVLLGVAAYRCGQRLEWDAASLTAKNVTDAEQFVKKNYRKGFEVVGV